MAIPLVNVEDIRTGKGHGARKGSGTGKYSKYRIGLEPQVPWLREEIGKSKDGSIRVKVNDILKTITQNVGGTVGRHSTSVYWGTKYILYQEGLWVTQAKTKKGDDALVIRKATEDDKLPPSLLKQLEKEGNGRGEVGSETGSEGEGEVGSEGEGEVGSEGEGEAEEEE